MAASSSKVATVRVKRPHIGYRIAQMKDDDPFAMLERSHRRLEERLADLETADEGIARDVAEFFDRAVRRHEDDEERSLFPRLSGHEALLAALSAEHRAHERLHAELRDIIAHWDDKKSQLPDLVKRLRKAYDEHILREERELFPAARAVLVTAEQAAMLREMDERRGRGGGGGGGRGRR